MLHIRQHIMEASFEFESLNPAVGIDLQQMMAIYHLHQLRAMYSFLWLPLGKVCVCLENSVIMHS